MLSLYLAILWPRLHCNLYPWKTISRVLVELVIEAPIGVSNRNYALVCIYAPASSGAPSVTPSLLQPLLLLLFSASIPPALPDSPTVNKLYL